MPKNHYSVAVGSKHGPRSARWIVTVSDRDVYVSTARCQKFWHVSLHSSGRWHLKQHRQQSRPETPVLKVHRDAGPEGSYRVGLHIGIPDSCLRPASDPDRTSVPDKWLPRPPYGGVTEIAVMQWNAAEAQEEWPGKAAGTTLLAAYRTSEHHVVVLLVRYLGPEHPIAASINARIGEHTRSLIPIVLDSPERRGYIAGANIDGAITLLESAID